LKKQLQFSILDLAKALKRLNKGAAIKHFKPLSLSLQKEIAQRNILVVTDFGEKALYADDQALFSYRFEI
jgi:hypothetical protein